MYEANDLRNHAEYQAQIADARHHTYGGFQTRSVRGEIIAACKKFPLWPTDMLHAATIIQEEAGEIAKAVLQYHYEPNKGVTEDDIRMEAIQTIAMCHRFLNSLDKGMYAPPQNYKQHTLYPLKVVENA